MKTFFLLLLTSSIFAAVHTQPLTQGSLSQSQSFNGTLYFNEQSKLASQSSGVITKIYFDEGDYVKKGARLLDVDAQELLANITSSKALLKELDYSLQKAKLDFNRYETLLKKQSVSKQKYDEFYFQKMQLEQKKASLEASLKAQKIALSKKTIHAPFSGFITQRNVNLGEWLNEGSQVARLINPNKIDVLIHLPSSYINTISNHKNIPVRINDKVYESKVIGSLLGGNLKTRTFPLKLRLLPNNDTFFEGMQAHLSLEKPHTSNTLLISRDGVIKRFGKDVVFILKDNKAQMIPVNIIAYEGLKVAISSPKLKVGDLVITKGNERIQPNQEIKP